MQFSGDAGALDFLPFDQLAADAGEGLLGLFALGNVDHGTDETHKGVIRVVPGQSMIENPAVFSIAPAKPILHRERLATIEGIGVGLYASIYIFRVQSGCPAGAQLLFEAAAGEVEPGLVDIVAQRVRASHPDHYRSGVGNEAKTLFAFLRFFKSSG